MPIMVNNGKRSETIEVYSTQQEEDRLAKYAFWAYKTEDARVCVISDDTDVFTLLCNQYQMSGLSFGDAIIS